MKTTAIDALRGVSTTCNAGSLITGHEGKRLCVYVDSTGHHTIGIGYNLDTSAAKGDIAKIGANFADIYSGKTCLTDGQCSALFAISLGRAKAGAAADDHNYGSLCCGVRNVISDLAFNLGTAQLAGFG